MRFHLAEKSDKGIVRKRNEDYSGKHRNEKLNACLFCVADGMGGYGLGDVASRMVVEGLLKDFAKITKIDRPIREWVIYLYNQAEDRLRSYRHEKQIERFGTTLATIIFMDDVTVCANIGDTRIYSMDTRSMIQESHDHTLVNQMLQAGQITVEEADAHPNRHMLTLALTGERETIEPYISIWPFDPVRTYLIASDGLYNMVDEKTISHTLTNKPPIDAADELFAMALENGATDNVTFQIIKPLDE